MKNYFKLVLSLFAMFAASVSYAIPQVSFVYDQQDLKVGDVLNVDVKASDLPKTEGGGFSVVFDSSKLKAVSSDVNTNDWTFKTHNGDIDNDNGRVSNVMFTEFDGNDGSVKLASLVFEVLQDGDVSIGLEESTKSPFASNGEKINVQYGSLKLSVSDSLEGTVSGNNGVSGGMTNIFTLFVMMLLLVSKNMQNPYK